MKEESKTKGIIEKVIKEVHESNLARYGEDKLKELYALRPKIMSDEYLLKREGEPIFKHYSTIKDSTEDDTPKT